MIGYIILTIAILVIVPALINFADGRGGTYGRSPPLLKSLYELLSGKGIRPESPTERVLAQVRRAQGINSPSRHRSRNHPY